MPFATLGKHRFQAAIAGRLLNEHTAQPVPGVRVQIVPPIPAAFQVILSTLAAQHGAAWSAMTRRPDLAHTEADGVFHFGDLPDGAYTITFTAPGGDAYFGTKTTSVTVSHGAGGAVTTPFVSATLPPTAVTGTVLRYIPASGNQPATTGPLRLALVQVRGLHAAAHTGATGGYYLTGADPGPHTLQFSAPGYTPATAAVSVQKGVIVTAPAITLVPAP